MFRNIPTTTFYIHLKNKYNFFIHELCSDY
ncbi:unknown [Prevotella sp. CAG:474]|nr:unknown [Prevotella sp. CAG:474]